MITKQVIKLENDNIKDLKKQISFLKNQLKVIKKVLKNHNIKYKRKQTNNTVYNKDGIPLNSTYIGYTKKSKIPFILSVDKNGRYFIKNIEFESLSAAAEYVSGVRRSGWSFWKNINNGKTLKEMFKEI